MTQVHSLELLSLAFWLSKAINTWSAYFHPSTQARTDHHAMTPAARPTNWLWILYLRPFFPEPLHQLTLTEMIKKEQLRSLKKNLRVSLSLPHFT